MGQLQARSTENLKEYLAGLINRPPLVTFPTLSHFPCSFTYASWDLLSNELPVPKCLSQSQPSEECKVTQLEHSRALFQILAV